MLRDTIVFVSVIPFVLFISVSFTDASTIEYDQLNRIHEITYDDGTTVTYSYDDAGNIISRDITQPGPCEYSIFPESDSFDAGADTGSVSVTAPDGCDWTATSNNGWITITSGHTGSGAGTVEYAIASNPILPPRTGTMTIAGKTFSIYQTGTGANSRYVPDHYATIRAALDASVNGDTIVVRNGTWTGEYNRNLSFGGKSVTLQSENGPTNCILDCEGSGSGFIFQSGETVFSAVKGFTIINGNASVGGGIRCDSSSSPTIANCIISDNVAGSNGGGVYCSASSDPTITNCTISGNSAGSGGGGIWCADSSPSLTNCILWGDSAPSGPEIMLDSNSTLTVRYSDVEGGQAAASVGSGCTLAWGSGNIDADPLFVNPGYKGDYHVHACAVTIDAGHPACDYLNEPEPNGGRVNVGAYGDTSEASPLSFDTSWLATLPDIGGNSVPEVAVPNVNWTAKQATVQVKDLSSGLLVRTVWFSNVYKPLALEILPDLNANSSSELALLSMNATTKKVVVQIKDSSTGLLIRNVWFSTLYTPVALMVIEDLNANGFSELAVLSVDWVSGKVVLQIKDSSTGLLVKNIWFSTAFAPMTLDILPDMNSNGYPEIAVLSTDWSTGKVVVQIKDSFTGLLVKNVWFSNVFEPMALEVVDDLNANGSSELVVLSRNQATGKVVVQVKDSSTGLLVRNVWFSDVYKPMALKVVPDLNANGFPELSVLSIDWSTDKVVAQIKDSSTGLLLKNVWFSNVYAPVALQIVTDLNANGSSEQTVLSVNSSMGKVVVQVKDSSTGLLVKNIWF